MKTIEDYCASKNEYRAACAAAKTAYELISLHRARKAFLLEVLEGELAEGEKICAAVAAGVPSAPADDLVQRFSAVDDSLELIDSLFENDDSDDDIHVLCVVMSDLYSERFDLRRELSGVLS